MMRKLMSLLLSLAVLSSLSIAEDQVLFDNFEGGTDLWQTTYWGLSQNYSISPTHSFTESPSGPYPGNAVMTATSIIGANLIGYIGARLEFWARYEIEPAFDYCRVEASRDGSFWVPLGQLTGFFPTWQLKTYDLGAFAGLPNVRLRFYFFSDPLFTYDGLYIDDVKVFGLDEDLSGPLIIHNGPEGYSGLPGMMTVYADIWDASGVSDETMLYRLDGRPFMTAPRDSIIGERYYHHIPPQEAGTLVEYYFRAVDATPQMHVSLSDTFAYLGGRSLILDDGYPESIFEAEPGDYAAVRFITHDAGYLTSALIRIYTDSSHPLDSINVYVWADSSLLPGPVIAGPFPAFPVSTPDNPEAWTWVDLRPALIVAPDTFQVGFEFASTGSTPTMALDYDSPARFFRSSMNIGSGWQQVTFSDFHIRCVVGDLTPDTLLAPDNLSGVGLWELLHLSWSPPNGLDDQLYYEIERLGQIIGRTQSLETAYTDTLTGLPAGEYTYRVRSRYSTGFSAFSNPFEYQWDPTGVREFMPPVLPDKVTLTVFPNPAKSTLKISGSPVVVQSIKTLILYDLLGREVQRWEPSGITTDGEVILPISRNLSAGIYLLSVTHFSGERLIQKIAFLP
ncbi:MAG: T9SS type A sorting domain-containing protein [bacterium]|nr:T9SS type A sorting domain-containing protein [bacterium]